MVTIDDDITDRAWIYQAAEDADEPFFVSVTPPTWLPPPTPAGERRQSGRWQARISTLSSSRQKCQLSPEGAGQFGITNNTFVMYSTDNGPHMNSWPDGAMTPFRVKEHQLGGTCRSQRSSTGRARSCRAKCPTMSPPVSPCCRRSPASPGRSVKDKLSPALGRRHDLQGPSRSRQPCTLPHRLTPQGPRQSFFYMTIVSDSSVYGTITGG